MLLVKLCYSGIVGRESRGGADEEGERNVDEKGTREADGEGVTDGESSP